MKLILFALIGLIAQPLLASDSTWLLCKGSTELFGQQQSLVVNVFEHRSGAEDRETEFVLIYGGHTFTGGLLDSKGNAEVVLTATAAQTNYATYKGTAEVDFDSRTLRLDGELDLYEKTPVNAFFECETLEN